MAVYLDLRGTSEQSFRIGINKWEIDASGATALRTMTFGDADIDFTSPANGDVLTFSGGLWQPVAGGGGGGANTALSNLIATAINQSLIADTNALHNIGSAALTWQTGYFERLYDDTDTPSIHIQNRELHDASGNPSLNYNARSMVDGAGLSSMDYESRQLYDNAANTSINYNTRQLLDSTSGTSLDFASSASIQIYKNFLPDLDATRNIGDQTLFFQTGYFERFYDTSGNPIIHLLNRMLHDSSGQNSVAFDNRLLYDAGGNDSISYGSRELIDASANLSLNYDTRVLADTSGNASFRYGDREFRDVNNDPAISYNFTDEVRIYADIATSDSRILRLQGVTGSVGLKAADGSIGDYTLPTADGSSGDVLSTNGAGQMSWVPAGGGGAVNIYRGASVAGPLIVQANAGLPIFFPENATIQKISAYVRTAPTGADIIVDVNKNGTTIFTTQANRPTIPDGTNVDASAIPDVTSITAGDVLEIDVDQIGSGTAGADLVVVIQIQE